MVKAPSDLKGIVLAVGTDCDYFRWRGCTHMASLVTVSTKTEVAAPSPPDPTL